MQITEFSCNFIKKYKNFTLGPLKLSLKRGKITAIVGPNGAGKTTLLHCLCGLRKPTTGEIHFPPLSHLAIVGIGDLPELFSIKEIIGFFGKNRELNKSIAFNLIKKFKIKENQKLKTLSSGQRMLCQWIVALSLNSPEALVLDEPFIHIDIVHKNILFDMLSETIIKRNIPCIISSHNILETDKTADIICFLKNGNLSDAIEKPCKDVFWVIEENKENEKTQGVIYFKDKVVKTVPKNNKNIKGEICDLQEITRLFFEGNENENEIPE